MNASGNDAAGKAPVLTEVAKAAGLRSD